MAHVIQKRPSLPADPQLLRVWVLEEHLPPAAIATRLGVSAARVRMALRRLELPCLSARPGLTQREQALARYYALYQKSAEKRAHEFALTFEFFATLVSESCAYCGSEPTRNVGGWRFSGIDRVENDRGYLPDNVRPCCSTCNLAKRRMSEQDFIAWILRAAAHLQAQQPMENSTVRRKEDKP